MNILTLDPSFTNVGYAIAHVTNGIPTIRTAGVIRTQRNAALKRNRDDWRRAQYIHQELLPLISQVDHVFLELPQISGKNTQARSMWSSGIVLGVLASITKPIICIDPMEAKVAAVGDRTAEKQVIIDWATRTHPETPWLTRKFKGQLELLNINEHIADAIAVLYAGLAKTPLDGGHATRVLLTPIVHEATHA